MCTCQSTERVMCVYLSEYNTERVMCVYLSEYREGDVCVSCRVQGG